MLIYDIDFIRELKLDRLYITTTNKIIPNISEAKFLTIVLGEMNEYEFPIIWVLSTDYSRETVENIVREIKNVLIKGHAMQFKEIYSDCFKNLQDHVDMEFHQVHEKKVSFDSICKVLRTAAHGIIDENNPEINQILRKIMSLTLLPFYLIDGELKKIGENLPNDGADTIKEFITYYEQKWKKDLLPKKYSIFEDVRAINDVSEIHLRVLKNSLPSENPSFWKFIESIGTNLAKHVKDCRKFQDSPKNYKIKFTPRVNCSINNNRERSVSSGIKKLSQLLSEHRIDASEYLERAVVVMRDYYNDFFFDKYLLEKELTDMSNRFDAFFAELPDTSFLFENDLGVNDDDEVQRSDDVVNEMQRVIDGLQPADVNVEIIDGNEIFNVQCRRCNIAQVTTINFPCRHIESCDNCITRANNVCSICNTLIDRTVRIFLPNDTEGDGYNLNCEICYEKPTNIMWTTCNHGLTCRRCAVAVIREKTNSLTTKTKIQCPHCNVRAEGFMEFKLSAIR
ncbi:uncharacterized protein LOC123268104 [Cotesia glomerata]|nr:uncharacterized protein LOC123268104 [Cotesia glomerata]